MAAKPAADGGMSLEDILVMARKREMNVAMVIGKDGLSVAGDPRKPPEVMWREAKKAGGGAKGGMGICTVEGKELHFRLMNDDAPATLKKALKVKLRDAGLKYKVVLILPDGTVDGDDEEGAAAEGGDDLVLQLRIEFDALVPIIATARLADLGPVLKKIEGLVTMFETELARDTRKAKAILGLLKQTLEAERDRIVTGLTPGFILAEKRREALTGIEQRIDTLLAEFA
ncbi:hypothetical protein [Aphanothece stagnina]|uniref:hypothetical protein n=1 Tax=Aphanothece stagnina TaxID=1004305 RepID=UPI00398F7511